MLRNTLARSYIHGVASAFPTNRVGLFFFFTRVKKSPDPELFISPTLARALPRQLYVRNCGQLRTRHPVPSFLPQPFASPPCHLSPNCLYGCRARLLLNAHFLRVASLFFTSASFVRFDTLYLESHLHHYDISGGQVRTATYRRVF